MTIELEVISQYPLPEKGRSIAKYVPMRVFQKKLFVTESMQIEENIDSKGATIKQFTICKYDTEYYKINMPYKELRDKYFTPIVIKGLHNA
jgi:hypothetical protein